MTAAALTAVGRAKSVDGLHAIDTAGFSNQPAFVNLRPIKQQGTHRLTAGVTGQMVDVPMQLLGAP